VIDVQKYWIQFVVPTEEITRIHVCAHVEEIVRNIQKDSVLKKKAVLDVQEYYNQYVAKKE